jgi:hypothetical protein
MVIATAPPAAALDDVPDPAALEDADEVPEPGTDADDPPPDDADDEDPDVEEAPVPELLEQAAVPSRATPRAAITPRRNAGGSR